MTIDFALRLRPWGTGDPELLRRLNEPHLMEHLGGPESEEKVRERDARYVRLSASGEAFIYALLVDGVEAGVFCCWQSGDDYEAGWSVLSQFHGRGVARASVGAALDEVRAVATRRFVHAYPKLENVASNALCRSARFELLGEVDMEYPKGTPIRVNDWRYDLQRVADGV